MGFLTRTEAAARLGIGATTLYEKTRLGHVQVHRYGRSLVYDEDYIDRIAAELRTYGLIASQVATRLGVSVDTATSWGNRGFLPTMRIIGSLRFHTAGIVSIAVTYRDFIEGWRTGQLCGIAEVSRRLDLAETIVQDWLNRGYLPSVLAPNGRRFVHEKLVRDIESSLATSDIGVSEALARLGLGPKTKRNRAQ